MPFPECNKASDPLRGSGAPGWGPHSCRGSRGERGIFVPLAALVLAGVLGLLFAAGIDALLLRVTRSELQRIAQSMCGTLAYEALTPDLAAPSFQTSLMALKDTLTFGKLDGASLILPIPREDALPPLDPANACSGPLPAVDDYAATPASGSGAPVKFGDIGSPLGTPFPACSLYGGNDCELVLYPHLQLPSGFPESARTALLPGRSIGCQLTAQVKRYSGGPPGVAVGRALYSSRPRHPGGAQGDPQGPSSGTPSALRIAIGTEMATPPIARLAAKPPPVVTPTPFNRKAPFSFATMAKSHPNYSLDPDFLKDQDPFCEPVSDPTRPWCTIYQHDPSAFIATLPAKNFLRAFSGARPLTPIHQSSPTPFVRGGWPLSASQFHEMLVSCLNPPALVRNLIAQTVVEMASRDPALRHRTEILHLNPRNLKNSQIKANPPSQIVPLGRDLTERAYQIPYVRYQQEDFSFIDSTGTNRVLLGIGKDSTTIAPFSDELSLSDDEERIHATLASQLRVCYHLFTGRFDGAATQGRYKGISRFSLGSLFESPYGFLNSSQTAFNFEPILYPGAGPVANGRYRGNVTSEDPSIPSLPSDLPALANQKFQPQEQENPWPTGVWSGTHTRLLSAGEVVSSLGSTQRCPYSDIGDPANPDQKRHSNIDDPTKPEGRYIRRCPSSELNDGLTPRGHYPSKNLHYSMFPVPKDEEQSPTPEAVIELLPDLQGLFTYLVNPSPLPSPPPVRALKSPGLFHKSHPPDGEIKSLAPCSGASLVLIVNNLFAESDLTSGSRPPWGELFLRFRAENPRSPIVVFYVPASPAHAHSRAFEGLLNNFTVQHALQDPYLSIVPIGPTTCQPTEMNSDIRCTEAALHSYWLSLLDPTSRFYIVPLVRRIISDRLYRVERVL